MRFCQSFMNELQRHVGPNTDVPGGDIGVGGREIGYLFGQYRKLRNEFTGVLTGKGQEWGGSRMRPEATGYGVVYFAEEMLNVRKESLQGKRCLVSGSGKVALFAIQKLVELRAKVISFSDSSGYIFDGEGLDPEKVEWLMELKTFRRGRVREFAENYPSAEYRSADSRSLEENPLWCHEADCAFPCATQNEINGNDAQNLVKKGIQVVAEGASMPTTREGMMLFAGAGLLYGPGKAANAGGIAVSGLEMAQNSMRLAWTREELDGRLRVIMKEIHSTCRAAAEEAGTPGNYVNGANIAGFIRVADAMIDQGIV